MKTNELTGAALDWAVAKCEGLNPVIRGGNVYTEIMRWTCPSSDWAQGGPIIEREKIDILVEQQDLKIWAAEIYHSPKGYIRKQGISPLQAAMRCYVAFKLGDTVEIPKELYV